MSYCCNIENLYFIEQLKSKINDDVILFGVDGMLYFGKLDSIDTSNIAQLSPSSLSSTDLVEIQNPAEVAAVVNTVSINASTIVGFGFNIKADPFVLPDDNAEDVPEPQTQAKTNSCNCDDENCNDELINKLKTIEQLVTISTLGGFLFSGELLNIKEKTAKLDMEYIFAPGGDGSTLFSINKILVNLKAATAVAS